MEWNELERICFDLLLTHFVHNVIRLVYVVDHFVSLLPRREQ